jgi:hypothetical protein
MSSLGQLVIEPKHCLPPYAGCNIKKDRKDERQEATIGKWSEAEWSDAESVLAIHLATTSPLRMFILHRRSKLSGLSCCESGSLEVI